MADLMGSMSVRVDDIGYLEILTRLIALSSEKDPLSFHRSGDHYTEIRVGRHRYLALTNGFQITTTHLLDALVSLHSSISAEAMAKIQLEYLNKTQETSRAENYFFDHKNEPLEIK